MPRYLLLIDNSERIRINSSILANSTGRSGAQATASMNESQNVNFENLTTISGKRGVYILGSSDNNTVMNCDFIDPSEAGVYIEGGSDRNTIGENRMTATGVTPLATVYINGGIENEIIRNKSLKDGVPAVRLGGTPATTSGNVLIDNVINKGLVIINATADLLSANPHLGNKRLNRLFEISSYPVSFGRYQTGDILKLISTTVGNPLYYVCLFSGEYGSGTDPVFAKAAITEVV